MPCINATDMAATSGNFARMSSDAVGADESI
jgi:hypothetical protein